MNEDMNENVTITLTTGYEVDMDTTTVGAMIESFDHLFRAIVIGHMDKRGPGDEMWNGVEDEIEHIVVNVISDPAQFIRYLLSYEAYKTYDFIAEKVNEKADLKKSGKVN